jgi:hypothetical protein
LPKGADEIHRLFFLATLEFAVVRVQLICAVVHASFILGVDPGSAFIRVQLVRVIVNRFHKFSFEMKDGTVEGKGWENVNCLIFE